ncbi:MULTISPECIES: pitrilysin family protein [Rhodomicrobium]|uniref:M16 family metallopeptidase n=1 Tax=Rhodomicrobium TaxID=1068 RepID=UPI001FDA3D2D|nr:MULTISPECIES: pitrilysin family protein [Rhodomicrobium]
MVLIGSASAASAASSDVTHTKLANGMEVVVIPDHRAPVATHIVFYKVGAADEPQGKSGIAHFLEHLMFKGTQKIAPAEFSKIVARNGGQDNAFTTQDTTAYFQRVATDRLPLVMDMEADRMVNLRLLEEDVVNERKVVLEERRTRVDNDPGSILSEQMSAALYLAHPYGIPVIGWEHEIKSLSRQDALDFYKRFYSPDNAILVVAGDVEPEAVIKLANETYGKVKPTGLTLTRQRVDEPEPQAPRRVVLKDPRVAKDTLSRQYLAPSYATAADREAEALELLSAIIGSSSTGRLYKKLVVEDKKASAAGAWYGGESLDSGTFGLYAVAAGDTPLSAIEAAADEVIAEVRDKGVTEPELTRARNAQIAELVYKEDSQFNQARTYGWAMVTGRSIADMKDRAKRLEAVTLADIQTAAQKYLDLKRSVTGELLAVNKTLAARGKVSVPGPTDTIH